MKKQRLLITISSLSVIAFGLLLLGGCGKQSTASAPSGLPAASDKAIVEATSFNNVARYLDTGGNLFLYLSTEQWLKGLSDQVSKWRDIFSGMPMPPVARENMSKTFDFLNRIIRDSGVQDVSGFGMSSVALDQNLYRTRIVLHHYEGKGSGFGWSMFGKTAHDLDGLDMAPATTALAVFSDFDAAQCWSVVKDEIKHSGFPQVQPFLERMPAQFKRSTGLDWDKVLGSLGGEYGVILTLDDSSMVTIPLPTAQPLEIPEPGVLIMLKTTDDTLFNRLEQSMTQTHMEVIRVNKDNLKMRTIAVPVPLPVAIRFTVATANGWLFIASNDALVENALAVKSGLKQGLKSTDEFKLLSKDMPTQGNRYSFISKSFGVTYMKIQQQVMAMQSANQPGIAQLMKQFMNPDNAQYAFCVGATTDEGWVGVSTGNQNGAIMLAAAPIAVAAAGTAMVLPALAQAKARAATINARNARNRRPITN